MLHLSIISRRVSVVSREPIGKAVRAVAFAVTLLGGLSISSTGNALVVGPGEAFQIDFSFSAAPVIPGGADGLVLTASGTTTSGPGIPVNAALFDGPTLLGAGEVPFSIVTAFVSPFSLFSGITANVDPVVDGSIDGRIRITPDFPGGDGFLDFSTATLIIRAIRGTPTGVVLAPETATIEATTVVSETPPVSEVPLPASLFLLLSALAVLGFVIWRRTRTISADKFSESPPAAAGHP